MGPIPIPDGMLTTGMATFVGKMEGQGEGTIGEETTSRGTRPTSATPTETIAPPTAINLPSTAVVLRATIVINPATTRIAPPVIALARLPPLARNVFVKVPHLLLPPTRVESRPLQSQGEHHQSPVLREASLQPRPTARPQDPALRRLTSIIPFPTCPSRPSLCLRRWYPKREFDQIYLEKCWNHSRSHDTPSRSRLPSSLSPRPNVPPILPTCHPQSTVL